MNSLLVIDSSPRSSSVSRRLTHHVSEQWKQQHADGRVVERDLTKDAPPFLTESWIVAAYTPAERRTDEQKQLLAYSDQLIRELEAADLIVIGAPMHNFSISAYLKAWIDLVTRAGKTFSYGDKGPQGLLSPDKKVLLIATRGGAYEEGSPADFQVPYLRHMLRFIGLTDLTVVDVDKQAFGPEAAQLSVDTALKKLSAEADRCHVDLAASA
jgi:FMN-dependent NADH-azoreductase